MQIKKKSPISGKTHVKEIDVTERQLQNWSDGMLIQQAMPHLSGEDREFLMSGITKEEWDETYGEDE